MRAGLADGADLSAWGDANIVPGDDAGDDGAVQVAISVRIRFFRSDQVRACGEIRQLIVVGNAGIDDGYLYALARGKGMQLGTVGALVCGRFWR